MRRDFGSFVRCRAFMPPDPLLEIKRRQRARFRPAPLRSSSPRQLEVPLAPPPSAGTPLRGRRRLRGKTSVRWIMVAAAVAYTTAWPNELSVIDASPAEIWGIGQRHISASIAGVIEHDELPSRVDIEVGERHYTTVLEYTLDPRLQQEIGQLLTHYGPDYGAFVALEPRSGRVLSMASYTRDPEGLGNLALRATFPAASVFKIITAAAAIEEGKADAETVIPFNGKTTSLYKRQVLQHKDNKWTRRLPLRVAFGKSVNAVFGRLGAQHIGAEKLDEYAARFGFNRDFVSDVTLHTGQTDIRSDDVWSVVEAASGYTRANTLSPLHAAMVAAAVVNDGVMPQPYIVEAGYDPHGVLLYAASPETVSRPISRETARELRVLMRETVRTGSARRSFQGFFKGDFADVDVGGKTGSLTGLDPKGKNDWFVGYAEAAGRRLAFAALTVNRDRWQVKSSYLARKMVERYFTPDKDAM